jgi:hypothetical protein
VAALVSLSKSSGLQKLKTVLSRAFLEDGGLWCFQPPMEQEESMRLPFISLSETEAESRKRLALCL